MVRFDSDNPWKSLVLTSMIGINLLVCVASGYFVGSWFSAITNGSYIWVIVGIMIGIASGIFSIVALIKHYGGL